MDGATAASHRTFVAVDIPAAVRKRLAKLRSDLPGARWSDPDQYHITLRFLGRTAADDLPKVQEALSRVAVESFDLTLDGFGTFPAGAGRRPPRTMWVRPRDSEALVRLQNGVEAAVLRATGIAEDKVFRPHVTIARFRRPPAVDDLARWLDAANALEPQPFRVERFRFYASELTQDGAVHSVLAEYELS